MTNQPEQGAEPKLSKMQTVRKRELRRAIKRIHDKLKLYKGGMNEATIYGGKIAITVLGEMRKEIDRERQKS